MTSDGTHTYQWDGEGRVVSVDGTGTVVTYDAFGQRVQKVFSGNQIQFLFDPQGTEVARYNAANAAWWEQEAPMGGGTLAEYANASTVTWFYHRNHLGSVGMITDQSGAMAQDRTFYPWVQGWGYAGTSQEAWFAGFVNSEPDSPCFYAAPYRTYDQYAGRWLTPDPLAGDVSNPQSLNRYAYVLNNPTTLTDPLGLQGQCPLSQPDCYAPPPNACPWGYWNEFGIFECNPPGGPSPYGPPPQGNPGPGGVGGVGTTNNIGQAINQARNLLSKPKCADFLKRILRNLGLPQDLDQFLKDFDQLNIVASPGSDPGRPTFTVTAHVDDVGQNSTVHADSPGAADLPQVLLHETFHTIYFGLTDIQLGRVAGAPACPTGDRQMSASRNVSAAFDENCGQ